MDVDAAFEALDVEIAELDSELEACRRGAIVARAAFVLGGLALLSSLVLPALRTPTVAFAAVAAMIGGVVWIGASKTSREQLDARLAEVHARKAALFDRVAAANGWRDITPTIH